MAAVDWTLAPALITDAAPGVTPSTDPNIDNALDIGIYRRVFITVDTTGGTDPYVDIDIWVWNSTRFVVTGETYRLEPGVVNLVSLDGGVRAAFVATAGGTAAPTAWALNVGGQR